MRLAVVNYTGGGMSGGYRKYLQNILPLLYKNPSIQGAISVFIPPQIENTFNIDKISIMAWPKNDHKHGLLWLKEAVKKISPDIVFIPTARLIEFDQVPTITMVQNMEPLCAPFGGNPILESLKNISRAISARRACSHSDRIIAVSKHVKNFLTNRWKLKEDRIGLVYHGIELPDYPDDLKTPDFSKGEGITKFIFTAGSIRPARGLEDVLSALKLTRVNNPDLKLLIAGSVDSGMQTYKRKLYELTKKLEIDSMVIWAGPLNADDMSWCYSNCSVFVMSSRAEACPNIVLEAMAHGCVCVSTATPPMPEFFSDTALFYPAGNGNILANAIQKSIAFNKIEKNQIYAKAKKRASQFSWEDCAEKTVLELKKAVEQHKYLKGSRR